jgi:uncharacterized repeat protein (TIGR04138 family)
MPEQEEPLKPLEQVAAELGDYPVAAFQFVRAGLQHTVHRIHGRSPDEESGPRHVGGRELCEGLRDLAIQRWGMLAGVVLERWNITSTMDFGRIVFALVDSGWLSKTESDVLDDFKNVYDFRAVFERDYRIEDKP